ncbi:glycosyltransferase family 2 protein [Candidatus Nitrosotenuis chungbukensis]|uniref:glycosyltransferase family 2 protein n=1 Tax=Candidatus Nitrosotenuis chungbukensis TaxID=1353246 RepID=UPI0005B2980E|nr:glycosyltransferase family 2 protein [Candidatus Nitrosotenuis chungbukensis]WKT58308.1 glycosyltransferase family 2 protein [Candidatus Nitrosotenuis chungbukensis]
MSENKPLVSIIILNYNAGDLLLDCVQSVFKTDYTNIELIVVDNASTDSSHLRCKERFPNIVLIENKGNLGYCEGNNVGIRQAAGDFIAILNPDTIVSPKWLQELISAYREVGEGLYQPKILSLYEKNVIQSTGNMIHLFGFGFARDKGVLDSNQHSEIEQIGYASGTCLFTSANVLKRIGLLDSFLFLYHDDLDLGWRAAQMGIKSYYVPSAMIYHVESYSLKWSSKKFFWLERNRRYCLLTHYSMHTYKKMKISLMLVEMMVWLFYLSKGFLGAKIRAEMDIKRNRKYIENRYKELEEKKTVPDKELIKLFPDEIFVPKNVSGQIGSNTFNSIISRLSKRAKRSILS